MGRAEGKGRREKIVRFGYGLITCQRYPGDARTDADLYREALDLAQEAEELGFDSVWLSEHHFADDGYMPSLLPFAAAVAARTKRVGIGTGVVLAPLYPPLRLAEDSATVDLISGGRLVLGLGQGWLGWEFEAMGFSMRDRVVRTELAIRTCREAWGPSLVGHAGVAVTPKPSHPSGPPIWLAAISEPATRRAARIADGWLAAEPVPSEFERQVGWYRDELERVGREGEVAGYWPVFVWDGPDAWERVRPHHYYQEWKYEDAEAAKGRLGELPLPPPLDPKREEDIRRVMLCGTPDEVEAGIRRLSDIAGARFTFVARMYFPGMDLGVMRRSTRLFAEEVLPRFSSEARWREQGDV